MDDILNEANSILQCRDCPWYKSCVTPLRFSADDLRRQMEAMPGMNIGQSIEGLQSLLAGMATAAQNSILEGCPIFVERLRSDQKLAQKLKEIMQNRGSEQGGQG